MSVKVAPLSVERCHCTVGAGKPDAAAVNVTAVLGCTVWPVGFVVTAGAASTSIVSVCVASGDRPLDAVSVNGYAPLLLLGVPVTVAVPSWLSANVTPVGNVPDSVMVDTVGTPLVVTVKVPAVSRVK